MRVVVLETVFTQEANPLHCTTAKDQITVTVMGVPYASNLEYPTSFFHLSVNERVALILNTSETVRYMVQFEI